MRDIYIGQWMVSLEKILKWYCTNERYIYRTMNDEFREDIEVILYKWDIYIYRTMNGEFREDIEVVLYKWDIYIYIYIYIYIGQWMVSLEKIFKW